jgi:lysyl-tRNA synthetase class 2
MGREDQIINERLRKLKELRISGVNPYAHKFDKKNSTKELQDLYKKLKNDESSKSKGKVAGRLMIKRNMGKLAFATLQDGTGKIQIILRKGDTPDKVFELFKKYVDAGDFIGCEGTMLKTQRGEVSILVKKLELLTKSINPLPEKFHGLQDEDDRLRKRYLDILMNPEIKEMFVRKAKFWQTIRNFLVENDFLEVATPVLETSAGGAAASPFATHHNALDMDVFLRISMGELWQKKLMVAGYDKTFEIGRQFRNEGMDADHLQDYTQMEFYWAYADYNDGMKLVQELYKKLAKEVWGTTKFERSGHKFDLSKEWKIIDYASEIKKQTKIDIWKATSKEMGEKLKALGEEVKPNQDKWRLVDLLWKHCRRNIAGPAFLTGQPVDVSPLAKRNPEDPKTVEQFQPILAGSEIGNGYSELNDPEDQASRFEEQRKLKEAGDDEAHEHDESFIEALKHGMPPTCGFGTSDRLFSFLEGKPIRETVIFPLMKPEEKVLSNKQKKKLAKAQKQNNKQ